MSWFKVDDGFPDHPKVDAVLERVEPTGPLGLAAIGIWTLCGAWSMKHLTDGYVPRRRVLRLGGNESIAGVLIDAGLWEPAEGGWQFVDWESWQPTRREVEKKRKVTKERVTRYRDEVKRERNAVTNSVTPDQCNAPPVPSRPVPSRPVPSRPVPTERENAREATPPEPDPEPGPDVPSQAQGLTWIGAGKLFCAALKLDEFKFQFQYHEPDLRALVGLCGGDEAELTRVLTVVAADDWAQANATPAHVVKHWATKYARRKVDKPAAGFHNLKPEARYVDPEFDAREKEREADAKKRAGAIRAKHASRRAAP